MRAHEILPKITLAKIEKTGQVVQLVKHADQVGFSDEQGWFLINTNPGADTGPSTTVKWIPDTTRFAWVKKLSNIDEIQSNDASIQEYVNKDVMSTGWRDSGTVLDGRYRLEAYTKNEGYKNKPRLYVEIYDDNVVNPFTQEKETSKVGYGKFTIHGRFFKELQANMIHVYDKYRRQGVASAIYKYVHTLGNTIKPSSNQLGPGKDFWQGINSKGGIDKLEESELDEGYLGPLKRGEFTIPVNSHALDQAVARQVLPTDVDRILRKLELVRDQLAQIAGNEKFWIYDATLDVAIGLQKSDTTESKYYLNTVVGDRPYDSHVTVIDV